MRRWVQSPNFVEACEGAGWDEDWVREMFEGIFALPDNVRKAISSQCASALSMIVTLARNSD